MKGLSSIPNLAVGWNRILVYFFVSDEVLHSSLLFG